MAGMTSHEINSHESIYLIVRYPVDVGNFLGDL